MIGWFRRGCSLSVDVWTELSASSDELHINLQTLKKQAASFSESLPSTYKTPRRHHPVNLKILRWRERTNKMQLIRCLLSNFLSQHISGIIMPILRRIRPFSTACGVLPGCVGCGWLWSCGAASWAATQLRKTMCNRRTIYKKDVN